MKLTSEQKQEIADQQSQKNETKRVTSPELEKILYEALPVLDHGFVRVVDYMGDDTSIVQSARVSYGNTSALHQVLFNHNSTNAFTVQYPHLSIGSTMGIGTFGASIRGDNFILIFHPDPNISNDIIDPSPEYSSSNIFIFSEPSLG